MVDHVSLQVKSFAKALSFYTEALAPLGYVPQHVDEAGKSAGFGLKGDGQPWFARGSLWIAEGRQQRRSTWRSGVRAAKPLLDSTRRPCARGGRTTGSLVCAPTTTRATTPRSSSIPTGTMWRRSRTRQRENGAGRCGCTTRPLGHVCPETLRRRRSLLSAVQTSSIL